MRVRVSVRGERTHRLGRPLDKAHDRILRTSVGTLQVLHVRDDAHSTE